MNSHIISLIVTILFSCSLYSQVYNTVFTKTEYGEGKEDIRFNILIDGDIQITDVYYNKTKIFPKLKITKTGFMENNYFYEYHELNVNDFENYINKEVYSFLFVFDKKGGNLISISSTGGIPRTGKKETKIYFTEFGLNLF